ncbi:DHHC palmitoyltransferase-domain-containing protein [Mycena galopus ATCC 62051]|nr:DHHC palmitoyltransferase-domain-containing protein [Mycena galopus ATCC 62051]
MGYTGYVYAGRFAVRLMHGGRRTEGIGLLVGWSILYAWMVWAYIKIITTPPGNACDYVAKSEQPLLPPPLPTRTQEEWDAHDAQNGHVYGSRPNARALADIESGRIGGPAYSNGVPAEPPAAHLPNGNGNANVNAPPPRGRWGRRDTGDSGFSNHSTPRSANAQRRDPPRARTSVPLPAPHRFCARCRIVKPHRAHHCRVCGTCILKFDHHCPWIGQCVGARNHKFFLNFLFATACFTAYTFVSVLVWNVGWRGGVGQNDVDPQEVVLMALAALFLLFTLPLGVDHTRMILGSLSTVESLAARRLKEREDAALEAEEGLGCADVRAKRRIRTSYDAEWGHPATEGNVWWAGSRRAAWEDVMGRSWVGWIFPVGAPLGDGLHYVPNPRFDPSGRWRRRSEWPAELR